MKKTLTINKRVWVELMKKKIQYDYMSISNMLENNMDRITIKNKGGLENDNKKHKA